MRVGLDASTLIASIKRAGEKYHKDARKLSEVILRGGHEGVSSALLLMELPGALASTRLPVEVVYTATVSLLDKFNVSVMPYEPYVEKVIELMLEFRDLKARFSIPSADFHYLATSYQEGCELFVTTDERHLLRQECKRELSKYVETLDPSEAVKRLAAG